jgi:serine protease AprX
MKREFSIAFCMCFVLPLYSIFATEPERKPQIVERGEARQLEFLGRTFARTNGQLSNPTTLRMEKHNVDILMWDARENKNNAPTQGYYSLKLPNREWSEAKPAPNKIRLKSRTFDPLKTALPVVDENAPAAAKAPSPKRLYLVQFRTQIIDAYREGLANLRAQVLSYVPDATLVVRCDPETVARIRQLPFVRWVGSYQSGDRISQEALNAVRADDAVRQRFIISVFTKDDRERLLQFLKTELKASIAESGSGSRYVVAELTTDQVGKLLQQDFIEAIELATKPQNDVDNARCYGGATYLETVPPGYSGIGIIGHVMEGIHPDHPDFKANTHRQLPIAVSDSAPDEHGQQTFGEIFSDGTGNTHVKGIVFNAQGLFTNNNYVYSAPAGSTAAGSRYELVGRLIHDHHVMFQTASWGYSQITNYDARSKEMDDIIFDHDIPITQSQSNTGTQASRPQAWAKNIISVGALYHYNNCDPSDDRWNNGGSTGPASDGRIKPDLCAFYDAIDTTLVSSGYTTDFGGTSGATPIVAGYVGLTLEMWTNGIFGNTLPFPATPENRFVNRPHASTVKALMICSASPFELPPTTDASRMRQGWGFPSAKFLYDNRAVVHAINEDDVITNLTTRTYDVVVEGGQPVFKVTMVYNEPGANVTAAIHRINNLNLRVTAPDGTAYWGNNGLSSGKWSTTGGNPDGLNTVENVFIDHPAQGHWKVEVIADEINVDSHVETPEIDADYALVMIGARR